MCKEKLILFDAKFFCCSGFTSDIYRIQQILLTGDAVDRRDEKGAFISLKTDKQGFKE